MGSPEFSVPVLRKLADHYQIVGVVTQPDRPAGRGRVLKSPPIKLLADELKLSSVQPRKLSEPASMDFLRQWAPEIIVVAAFGQILRPEVLNLPEFGCINVHASLLPRWRGAAPIQAAILNGDEQTGITIMRMDPGIDTGPTLSQASIQIANRETAAILTTKLSMLGAELLVETLPHYLDGSLIPQAQEDSLATYAPMIKKEAGLLDFAQSAHDLERKVRAYNPWPGTYTIWKNQILKIHHAHVVDAYLQSAGKRIIYQELPAMITGLGIFVIDALQPAGKNIMEGKTFLRGARGWEE
jgi:methionyl-tRNA formyltransferase